MSKMLYSIYTELNDTPADTRMFQVLTADYDFRNYTPDGGLIYKNEVVSNSDIASDSSANIAIWKSIHSDWNELYNDQFSMPYSKYLAKCEFLGHVIAELEHWFNSRDIPSPVIIRKEFRHSEDYRSVVLHGKQYSLSVKDAFIIKVLHIHASKKTSDVSFAYIAAEYDEEFLANYKNIKDMFTSKRALRDLVIPGKSKGTVRLNL